MLSHHKERHRAIGIENTQRRSKNQKFQLACLQSPPARQATMRDSTCHSASIMRIDVALAQQQQQQKKWKMIIKKYKL
jgi:hypothetical protein